MNAGIKTAMKFAMKLSLDMKSIIVLILFSALLSNAAHAVKLYKWVDAEGNVSYQDQPPQKGQKFEEKSFSESGTNTQRNADVGREKAALKSPVTLYIAPKCDSCDLVRTVLDLYRVPYTQLDVEDNPDAQKKLIKAAGSVRVPSLTVGDSVVNGFNRNKIEDALREHGYPINITENQ